jgi:hypothetical protein
VGYSTKGLDDKLNPESTDCRMTIIGHARARYILELLRPMTTVLDFVGNSHMPCCGHATRGGDLLPRTEMPTVGNAGTDDRS